jgi:hypothetical protein
LLWGASRVDGGGGGRFSNVAFLINLCRFEIELKN